jgi:hypothetical protein
MDSFAAFVSFLKMTVHSVIEVRSESEIFWSEVKVNYSESKKFIKNSSTHEN